jgi:hypothetical protein
MISEVDGTSPAACSVLEFSGATKLSKRGVMATPLGDGGFVHTTVSGI